MPPFLTQKQAAAELGISRNAVGTMIVALDIPTVTQPGLRGKFIDRAGLKRLRAALTKGKVRT